MPKKSAAICLFLKVKEQILLEKRPSEGIWGGLHAFLQFDDSDACYKLILAQQGIECSSEILRLICAYIYPL